MDGWSHFDFDKMENEDRPESKDIAEDFFSD